LGRRVGLGDPQRSLPTPTILWFCDSVILTVGSGNPTSPPSLPTNSPRGISTNYQRTLNLLKSHLTLQVFICAEKKNDSRRRKCRCSVLQSSLKKPPTLLNANNCRVPSSSGRAETASQFSQALGCFFKQPD